jgi:iron complex outermembrane receptor protein
MLGGDIVSNDDALFTITGNVSHNDNLINDFAGQIPAGTIRGQGLSLAFSQILAEGQPLFSYYLREFVGFDKDGQPIRDNQKFVGKSALPVWNAGLSLRFSYKNFDISTYLAGQFDFWVYNNTRNAFFTAGAINNARNVTEDVLTSGEAGSAEAAVSERFLEKGDFVRMQDLTIGYSVPVEGSNLFQSLRFTFSAQNLFLITEYSGLDPEVSSQPGAGDLLNRLPTAGIDYTAYPRARTFSIGLNAKF